MVDECVVEGVGDCDGDVCVVGVDFDYDVEFGGEGEVLGGVFGLIVFCDFGVGEFVQYFCVEQGFDCVDGG